MKVHLLSLAFLAGLTIELQSAVVYVDVNSTNPIPPYTNWPTAASVIQDAVDAASPGDEVLVTNGWYATGGRAIGTNVLVNRVAVDKPLRLLSVNGPNSTFIQGWQVPGFGADDGAIRCVYLTNDALLSGFTLTNGATRRSQLLERFDYETCGGGLCCQSATAVASNCVLVRNMAYAYGGGAWRGTLQDCTLSANLIEGYGGAASGQCQESKYGEIIESPVILSNCIVAGNESYRFGGGVALAALDNCVVANNVADGESGGGAHACVLNNCIVSNNYAIQGGGGVYCGVVSNCVVNDNSTLLWGGGIWYTVAERSILIRNKTLSYDGGGAKQSTLSSCILLGNSAAQFGGGASSSTLNNCTVAANSATLDGGGAYGCTNNNCIIYGNAAPGAGANCSNSNILNYCCTTTQTANGNGNILSNPQFVDFAGGDLHLQSTSPCINAGKNSSITNCAYYATPFNASLWFTNLFDCDGNPRIVSGTVDIGAYEYQGPGSVIAYAWLQEYGLPIDGSVDFLDTDGDGMGNWQEWICGTSPTNAQSVLRIISVGSSTTNATVTWQSVAGVNYYLERNANLGTPFSLLAANITGQSGTTSYADTNANGAGWFFYRVRAQRP